MFPYKEENSKFVLLAKSKFPWRIFLSYITKWKKNNLVRLLFLQEKENEENNKAGDQELGGVAVEVAGGDRVGTY